MRKLTYKINEGGDSYLMEFITDRTAAWTEQQYMRHRNCTMECIGFEDTDETEPTSRKIEE